jgi:GR25 family glycosyltransferase involved in LPS biosynthesis
LIHRIKSRIVDLQNTSCISNFTFVSRGTLSLAVKHLLAARDIQLRNLPAGAIVEDDIELIPKFEFF